MISLHAFVLLAALLAQPPDSIFIPAESWIGYLYTDKSGQLVFENAANADTTEFEIGEVEDYHCPKCNAAIYWIGRNDWSDRYLCRRRHEFVGTRQPKFNTFVKRRVK